MGMKGEVCGYEGRSVCVCEGRGVWEGRIVCECVKVKVNDVLLNLQLCDE
jgi:hypothetical protein